jgi:hypothetical protein
LEHHTYSEDDVEEGGIKIKINFVHENGNFFRAEVGKKVKNFILIPNHHFWMSEGSLKKILKNIRLWVKGGILLKINLPLWYSGEDKNSTFLLHLYELVRVFIYQLGRRTMGHLVIIQNMWEQIGPPKLARSRNRPPVFTFLNIFYIKAMNFLCSEVLLACQLNPGTPTSPGSSIG